MFEINFLAYIGQQWFPCQTDVGIRQALQDTAPRWEKRMYHAIKSWKAKDPDAEKSASCECTICFLLAFGLALTKDLCFVFVPSAKPMMKALLRVLSETTISDNNVSVLLRRPGCQMTFETHVDHFPTATGSPTSIIGVDRSQKGYSFQVTPPIGFTGPIASIGSQLRRARKSAKRGSLQTRFWPQKPESRHATKIRG